MVERKTKRQSFEWIVGLAISLLLLSNCYGVKQAHRDSLRANNQEKEKSFQFLSSYLRKTLSKTEPLEEKRKAIEALGNHRNQKAFDLLRTLFLYEPSVIHQAEALKAITLLPIASAKIEMLKVFLQRNASFQKIVLQSFLKEPIPPWLVVFQKATWSSHEEIQIMGIHGIRALGAHRHVAILLGVLKRNPNNATLLKEVTKAFIADKKESLPILQKEYEQTNDNLRKKHLLSILPAFQQASIPWLVQQFFASQDAPLFQKALVEATQDSSTWELFARLKKKPTSVALWQKIAQQKHWHTLSVIPEFWRYVPAHFRLQTSVFIGKIAVYFGSRGKKQLLQWIQEKEDLSFHCALLMALGDFGKPAIPELTSFLKTSRPSHIKCAIHGFGRLGKQGIPTLKSWIEKEEEEFRISAIQAITSIPQQEITSYLATQTQQPSAKIRIEVARSLGKRQDKTAIPALRKMLSDPISSVVMEAIRSLLLLGDLHNSQLYLSAIQYDDFPPKPEYIMPLRNLGDKTAVPLLQGLLGKYLLLWQKTMKKGEQLLKKRLMQYTYSKRSLYLTHERKKVREILRKEMIFRDSSFCSFREMLKTILHLGEFPKQAFEKNKYKHSHPLNLLQSFPASCALSPSLQKLLLIYP